MNYATTDATSLINHRFNSLINSSHLGAPFIEDQVPVRRLLAAPFASPTTNAIQINPVYNSYVSQFGTDKQIHSRSDGK